MPFIGNTPQTQSFAPAVDYFSGNGVTVTFTLSRPVVSVAQLTVAVDNVIQNPSSAFTVSGNSITFTSAPLSGTNNIWVEYTSLITTYAAISQDPSVIGDITATGGFLAEGDFGNSYIDGTIVDYVTGNARITTGPADGLTIYNGGTTARTALAAWDTSGNLTNTGTGSFQGVYIGKGGGSLSTNTAVGNSALSATNASGYCTAVGYQALKSNTSAVANDAFGYGALATNISGSNNAAFGVNALTTNSSGGSNTAIGISALTSNTTASNQTAVGYQAAYSTTTGNVITAFGSQAGRTNTTGNAVTAIGYLALFNSNADRLTAVGQQALYSNTTGTDNVAVGHQTLYSNTTGANNTAYGGQALYSNTTANNNTAVGYQAGFSGTTSVNNTFVGFQAGYNVSTGGQLNVGIGYQAGYNTTTGSGQICIGYCNPSSGSSSWEIVIGTNGQTGKGGNTGFISPNGGGVYQGNNSSSWSTTSDRRLKKNIVDNTDGLNKITAIQVRNFEYRLPEEVDAELKSTDAINKSGVQLGVIAQELAEVLPECVKTESTGVMSVDTDNLTWYLINAVKELKAEVDSLKAQLEAK